MFLETPAAMALGVAHRFRDFRRSRKITLRELSAQSGVPYSTLRRFESTGEISFLAFVKLTSALEQDSQITSLFAHVPPSSIEDVIRENRLRAGKN